MCWMHFLTHKQFAKLILLLHILNYALFTPTFVSSHLLVCHCHQQAISRIAWKIDVNRLIFKTLLHIASSGQNLYRAPLTRIQKMQIQSVLCWFWSISSASRNKYTNSWNYSPGLNSEGYILTFLLLSKALNESEISSDAYGAALIQMTVKRMKLKKFKARWLFL